LGATEKNHVFAIFDFFATTKMRKKGCHVNQKQPKNDEKNKNAFLSVPCEHLLNVQYSKTKKEQKRQTVSSWQDMSIQTITTDRQTDLDNTQVVLVRDISQLSHLFQVLVAKLTQAKHHLRLAVRAHLIGVVGQLSCKQMKMICNGVNVCSEKKNSAGREQTDE
jgi:hypothetical protein